MEIKQIEINKIKPNNYNPNKMTEEKYKELVNEIKHLGKIPKPLILDVSNTIIDGEHTYRAAKELKFKEAPCEIVDVDDFEKRRLTFKYNQHGEYNQVLLGKMFKQMLQMGDITQKQLAEQIDITEGTIRNAILFFDIQNEFFRNEYEISGFSTSQIKMFEYLRKEINPTLAELWLKRGGEKEDLIEMIRYSFKTFKIKQSVESVLAEGRCKLQELVEEAIKLDIVCWQGINKYEGFINIYKKAISRQMFLRKVISAVFPWRNGMERTRGFFALHFERVWPLTDKFWFISILKFLLSEKAEFLLTPEELKEVCEEAGEYTSNVKLINYTDFQEDFLNRKIKSKYGALKKKSFYEVEKEIYINKLEEAPDYIKEAKFRKYKDEPDFKAMYDLWQLKESEDVKRILARKGFKPGIHNFDDVIARVRKGLNERDLRIKFDTLTPEQTVEETVKFLKEACKQFCLTVEERDFLDNEFEASLTEFLKNCKVEKYLSFALYSISEKENWIASFRRDFG